MLRAVGGFVVIALAAGWPLRPAPAWADWTVAAYVGAASTRPAALALAQPALGTDLTIAPVAFRGESFTPPVYYGYRLGREWPGVPWLGIEAEFVHLKVYARTDRTARMEGRWRGRPVDATMPIDDIVQAFSISHGVNLVLGNVVARLPLGGAPAPRLRAAFRAGVGPTVPHAESTVEGVRAPEGYELGGPAWQAAAGLEARLTRGLFGVAEYKLTRTWQRATVAGGEATVTLVAHHAVFGLGWRF
jgi:hypothetical protein